MVKKSERIVSIIVPVYEGEKYIRRCVESLTNQTYKELEIILIDDGSKDSSLEICNEIAKMDNRVKVYHHENIGVSATRNIGLDYATGTYVLFLDVDDWLEKKMIANMIQELEGHNADINICGFYYVDDSKSVKSAIEESEIVDNKLFFKKSFRKLYEKSIVFNIGTKLYKKEIIDQYNIRFHADMIVYEDVLFCLEYIKKTKTIHISSDAYYYYYQGNIDSATHKYKEKFLDSSLKYCDKLFDDYEMESLALKQAIVDCLFRAFLQEGYNDKLNKTEFYSKLERMKRYFDGKSKVLEVSWKELAIEKVIFCKLINEQKKFILWIITIMIAIKNGKEICWF